MRFSGNKIVPLFTPKPHSLGRKSQSTCIQSRWADEQRVGPGRSLWHGCPGKPRACLSPKGKLIIAGEMELAFLPQSVPPSHPGRTQVSGTETSIAVNLFAPGGHTPHAESPVASTSPKATTKKHAACVTVMGWKSKGGLSGSLPGGFLYSSRHRNAFVAVRCSRR